MVEVTTLEDYNDFSGSGALEDTIPGSFRWALRQYPDEPITVVFRVSGVIRLRGQLRCKRDNFTIAGQTAPGEGICFTHNVLNFGGSTNFIIRHIRSRIGDVDVYGALVENNSFIANNSSNFIINHCSFGWSAEENMNTYDNKFQTVQWCIIHEGLYNAAHKKATPRDYATQWGGSQAAYHHNILAHNNSRSCRFNGATSNDNQVFLEYINNINYN
ncbi:MAG: hypothetical protein LUD15_14870 [Bacteroides sp.]|nr:hypothetical protein [Bacteroides sp.]